jgi:hypothetical protein
MIDFLLLPVLLGTLLSVGFYGLSKSLKRRPSIWPAICIAFVIGFIGVLSVGGFSVFTVSFWTSNPFFFSPPLSGAIFDYVLFVFSPFALGSFVPSLIVFAFYRSSFKGHKTPASGQGF